MSEMSSQAVRRLARSLEREAHRAKKLLRAPEHPRPYFVSYLLRDTTQHWFDARFGTLYANEQRRVRRCFADVRVGSHRVDHVRDGGLTDNSTKAESYSYSNLPIGAPVDGLLHGVWQLTESRFREAAEDYLYKRADALHFRDENAGLMAFERRAPVSDLSLGEAFPEVDAAYWESFVAKASSIGKKVPGAYGCEVELWVKHTTRLFVSTEGSVVADRQPLWQLSVMLDYGSDAGVAVPWTLSWFVTDPRELPDLSRLKREMRSAFARMRAIGEADTLRAYSGPVLLDPIPAGLLMHEALGHRLEGNRLLSQGEGQTFRGAIGTQHLPEPLSMWDDPTLTHFEGKSLVGHYRHDDEGVPAGHTELVRDGKIKGYLSGRAGIGKRHHSNGHARNESYERPISRMGVTLVEGRAPIGDAALKRALIAEVERRGLPFGIHVLAADGGETATKSYDFQAFLGQIRAANRVYPDGREEPVRDVSFVGTPLNAIRGIRAVGKRREVDNSYCGAESGQVPVTTICPGLLVDNLELQSSARSPHAPHTYPLPWAEK